MNDNSPFLGAFSANIGIGPQEVKDIAARRLFSGALGADRIRALLEKARKKSNFSELFFENQHTLSLTLEKGVITACAHHHDKGVSARAIVGEQTGFAVSSSFMDEDLLRILRHAGAICDFASSSLAFPRRVPAAPRAMYAPLNSAVGSYLARCLEILSLVDTLAKSDPKIEEVRAFLVLSSQDIAVFATDGTEAYDVRPMVRLRFSLQARQGDRREQSSVGASSRAGLEFLTDERVKSLIAQAAQQVQTSLDARPSPAGEMPVVLGPGGSGVLFHEAVGHGLEGDAIRQGTSLFSGKKGDKIASDLCRLIDSGTLPGRRGSLSVDDEGTPAEETLLIDKGRLVSFLWDKHNAALTGNKSTGSARRASYEYQPLPRMRNTYLQSGESDPEEILREVKRGVYAKSFSGGEVDTTSGRFVFTCDQAFLIEDGKITAPLKGVSLIGSSLEVLQRIDAVGSDGLFDLDGGTCGKAGQWVPVGVGQPTLRLGGITVGGTN